jgi:hypothetical protein
MFGLIADSEGGLGALGDGGIGLCRVEGGGGGFSFWGEESVSLGRAEGARGAPRFDPGFDADIDGEPAREQKDN